MAYIPKDAEWYLADIILEIKIENEIRNIVHTNLMLIRANSPDEAYEKAFNLGKNEESEYKNPDGKSVKTEFRGLRDLNVIYDKLEDGAELVYEEDIDVSEEKIKSWITSKKKLNVFAHASKPENHPDYSSGEIAKDYEEYRKSLEK